MLNNKHTKYLDKTRLYPLLLKILSYCSYLANVVFKVNYVFVEKHLGHIVVHSSNAMASRYEVAYICLSD